MKTTHQHTTNKKQPKAKPIPFFSSTTLQPKRYIQRACTDCKKENAIQTKPIIQKQPITIPSPDGESDQDPTPRLRLPALGSSLPLWGTLPTDRQNREPDPSVFKPYHMRGIPMQSRDYESTIGHWNYSVNFFQNIGISLEKSIWLANKSTEYAVDNQLSLEQPTQFEALDRKYGTTPTGLSVPVYEW